MTPTIKFPDWYFDFIEVLIQNCEATHNKKTPIYIPIADNIPRLHKILKTHNVEHTPEHIISIANEALGNMAGHTLESEIKSVHGASITKKIGTYSPQFYIQTEEGAIPK